MFQTPPSTTMSAGTPGPVPTDFVVIPTWGKVLPPVVRLLFHMVSRFHPSTSTAAESPSRPEKSNEHPTTLTGVRDCCPVADVLASSSALWSTFSDPHPIRWIVAPGVLGVPPGLESVTHP